MKDKLTLKKIFNFEIITIIVILIVVTVLSVFMVDKDAIHTDADLKNWYINNYKEILLLEFFIFTIVNTFGIAIVLENLFKRKFNKTIIEEKERIKNGGTIEKPNYSIVIVDVLLNKIIDRYKMKESIKENVKNGVPLYLDIDPTDELYNRLMKLDLNLEDNYEEKAKFEEDVYFELNKLGFVKEAPTFVRLNYLKDINNIIHFGIILVLMYLLFIGGITAYAIIFIISYLVFTCKNVKLTKKGTTESLMIMLYNETNNNNK